MLDLPPQEVRCLAEVVYLEARGEKSEGQRAVAHVVINRSKKTGKPICTVIHLPNQFQVKFRKSYAGIAWSKAFSIAQNPGRDNTAGALYFRSVKLANNWGYRITTRIGQHNFYK
jgi:spore germination cell wall hydrolase CwlJ-like protein